MLVDQGPPGDLQWFLEELQKRMTANEAGAGAKYEVTLIGHSMGAMVINQLLRHNPDIECKNIVFLAAACSIHQFQQCTIPYLEAHRQTQFYNLCLHPTAEVTEADALGVVPRGSLLNWIDEFLNSPQTPLDRTLGNWNNILPAIYVIPREVRPRVCLKAFAMTADGSTLDPETDAEAPQKHGQFTDLHYWEKSFWEPLPADDPNLRQRIAQMEARLAEVDEIQSRRSTAAPPDKERSQSATPGSPTTRPHKKTRTGT